MSPTIFKQSGLRFFFFSREEARPHVHVSSSHGEAKIWIEPEVQLVHNHGVGARELSRALKIARERQDEIRRAWRGHFGG